MDSKNAKIIYENENVVFVQVFNQRAAEYYGPSKVSKNYDKDFVDGDLFFAINKWHPEPENIFTLFKPIDGKLECYLGDINSCTREDIIFKYPYLKSYIQDIMGNSEIYDLLLRIKNGKWVSNWELNRVDPLVNSVRFNESSPGKSRVKLTFDSYEDYWKLFENNLNSDDFWFANAVYSNYDTYQFESEDWADEDWKQGYLLRELNDENTNKLKEILKLLSPGISQLRNDDEWAEASELLMNTFDRESEEIKYEWINERNNCKERGAHKMIEDDCCNYFQNYGIFNLGGCFYSYVTTVSVLLSLYSVAGERHLTLYEVLSKIGSDANFSGWGEYAYEQDCIDFDEESFNRSASWQLDKIMGKIEDSDEFLDLKKFSENASKILKDYAIDKKYDLPKDKNKTFTITKLDPKTNKVHVVVANKNDYRGEPRSYDFDQFYQLLHQPELFENRFVRIR